MPAIKSVLAVTFLLVCFALPAVMPRIANIGYFALMGIGLLLVARGEGHGLFKKLAVLSPLVGGSLLAFAYAVTAKSAADMAMVLYFAPLYLVAPGVALLRAGGRLISVETVSCSAILGSLAAAIFALVEYYQFPGRQVGWSVNNPIHFGAVAVSLGFIGLAGIHSRYRLLRILSWLGPMFGLFTALIANTQGPLLAGAVMLIVALAIVIIQFLPQALARMLLAGGSVLGLVVAVPIAWVVARGYRLPSIGQIMSFLHSGSSLGPVNERFLLYGSGIRAWLAAPLFGHGAVDFVGVAAQFSPEDVVMRPYDHLHNDLIDFAVSAGIFGVIAYTLFVAAMPLAASSRAAWRSQKAAVIIGVPMAVGYVVMGMTNAMFGILTQTVLFGATLAIVTYMANSVGDPADTPEASRV